MKLKQKMVALLASLALVAAVTVVNVTVDSVDEGQAVANDTPTETPGGGG